MGRTERITRAIQAHDSKLYCAMQNGIRCVFRDARRDEVFEIDGVTVINVKPAPHLIFPLTDNFRMTGRPVDWGLEPIMQKLRESDSWSRDVVGDVLKQEEKSYESKERARDNLIEDFARDARPVIAKATSDVLVHNMPKIDRRRIKDGSRK